MPLGISSPAMLLADPHYAPNFLSFILQLSMTALLESIELMCTMHLSAYNP